MNQHEQRIAEILDSGNQPTIDELGQALAATMQERNAYRQMAEDMAAWLSKLVLAHARQDAGAISATLGEFVNKHVKIVPQSSRRTH